VIISHCSADDITSVPGRESLRRDEQTTNESRSEALLPEASQTSPANSKQATEVLLVSAVGE
jgi:hypothetical protein